MEISLPIIITAALVDSINPCAFAVLIFLITYLSAIGTQKKVLRIGFAYIGAVYISYLLAGLGLLTVVNMAGVSRWIYLIAAVLAVVFGAINIKDFFAYGKGISLAIPQSKKPVIKRYVQQASIPAAIVLGFLVSAFELPCTGGAYLAILSMLAKKEDGMSLFYLIIYNIIFVLPLVAILLLFWKGVSAERMESWRKREKGTMRLILGLVLLGLGVWMLLG